MHVGRKPLSSFPEAFVTSSFLIPVQWGAVSLRNRTRIHKNSHDLVRPQSGGWLHHVPQPVDGGGIHELDAFSIMH
jgi:hypothetical protein